MAKVKRSVLKEIVKECLLEILFEGIDSEPGYEEEPIREARQPRRRAPRPSSNDLAAAVRRSTNNQQPVREEQKKDIQESFVSNAVSELTEDPMMAAIFADTAQTTLREQKEGRRPPADNAAAVVEQVDDVSQIFEGAGNWAAIAFDERD
jgi:hypothetical protein